MTERERDAPASPHSDADDASESPEIRKPATTTLYAILQSAAAQPPGGSGGSGSSGGSQRHSRSRSVEGPAPLSRERHSLGSLSASANPSTSPPESAAAFKLTARKSRLGAGGSAHSQTMSSSGNEGSGALPAIVIARPPSVTPLDPADASLSVGLASDGATSPPPTSSGPGSIAPSASEIALAQLAASAGFAIPEGARAGDDITMDIISSALRLEREYIAHLNSLIREHVPLLLSYVECAQDVIEALWATPASPRSPMLSGSLPTPISPKASYRSEQTLSALREQNSYMSHGAKQQPDKENKKSMSKVLTDFADAAERMLTVARDAAERLVGLASAPAQKRAVKPWLLFVYGRHYCDVCAQMFCKTGELLNVLWTVRQAKPDLMPQIAAKSRSPGIETEGLIAITVSQVRQMRKLALAHREVYVVQQTLWDVTSYIDRMSDPELIDMQETPLSSEEVLQIGIKEIRTLDDLVRSVANLEQFLAAYQVIRHFDTSSASDAIPQNQDRKFVMRLKLTQVNTIVHHGVSVTVPVEAIVFSDGLAILEPVPPGTHYRHRLLDWYSFDRIYIYDYPDASHFHSFQLGIRQEDVKLLQQEDPKSVQPEEIKALPPGWEVLPEKNGKKYLFKPHKISQLQKPTPYRLRGLRQLCAASKDAKDALMLSIRAVKPANVEFAKLPYSMLGTQLETIVAHESLWLPSHDIPLLVEKSLFHIISRGITDVGVMRVGGHKKKLNELRDLAMVGLLEPPEPKDSKWSSGEKRRQTEEVVDLTGLLKLFLREMPTPLIPPACQQAFFDAALMAEPAKQVRAYAQAFGALPPPNKALLREILWLLVCVSANSSINQMNSTNLAIVTAPNIVRAEGKDAAKKDADLSSNALANGVVETLVTRYPDLFEAPDAPLAPQRQLHEIVLLKRKLAGHAKSVRSLWCPQDRKHVWSVDSDLNVRIWDTAKYAQTESFAVSTASVKPLITAMISVNDLLWLCTSSAIFVYDPRKPKEPVKTIPGIMALCAVRIPSRGEVWVGSDRRQIFVFDIDSLERTHTLADSGFSNGEGDTAMINAIVQAPDGTVWAACNVMASKGDHRLQVWDCTSEVPVLAQNVPTVVVQKKRMTCIAVVDQTIWTGSDDGSIAVWDCKMHMCIGRMEGHSSLVLGFAVLSDQVWSCSHDSTIVLWEPKTRTQVGVIRGIQTDTISSLLPCADAASGRHGPRLALPEAAAPAQEGAPKLMISFRSLAQYSNHPCGHVLRIKHNENAASPEAGESERYSFSVRHMHEQQLVLVARLAGLVLTAGPFNMPTGQGRGQVPTSPSVSIKVRVFEARMDRGALLSCLAGYQRSVMLTIPTFVRMTYNLSNLNNGFIKVVTVAAYKNAEGTAAADAACVSQKVLLTILGVKLQPIAHVTSIC
eukprot:m51a1_g12242 putative domain-containing protein (1399) ;mRNA; r:114103-120549